MTQERMTTLFFEIFSDLPRQGPGDATSTLEALSLLPEMRSTTRVLDIGCGTGAQTRVIAQHSPARIVALDNHEPYVDELRRTAERAGLADRIDARVADMQQLDLPDGPFDVLWCEGAIYVVGFEKGLREWRRLLTKGGYAALTEVCWTKPDPPAPCAEFWAQEYPSIDDVASRLATIAACGYEIVGHFTLPSSSWWDDYYRPLERSVEVFRARHGAEPDALALADSVQREIDMWRAYSDFYGYEFFVMRAP
jgi:cyclopropane fatty-acyl-phospholipid synthase-like methyltransferase